MAASSDEESTRRSPHGAAHGIGLPASGAVGVFSVVMSMTRKRRRVAACPVLLVNLRRSVSVPKALLTP